MTIEDLGKLRTDIGKLINANNGQCEFAEDVLCRVDGLIQEAIEDRNQYKTLLERGIRGLRFSNPFPQVAGADPHPLNCTLAGRVSYVFGAGMTRSIELCRQYGVDPNWNGNQQ